MPTNWASNSLGEPTTFSVSLCAAKLGAMLRAVLGELVHPVSGAGGVQLEDGLGLVIERWGTSLLATLVAPAVRAG
jgi:hypothetical protein